jgi:hypothetical protein
MTSNIVVHLSVAHGFTDWHTDDFADHYPDLYGWDGFDFHALHERDHRESWDLDHEHEQVQA